MIDLAALITNCKEASVSGNKTLRMLRKTKLGKEEKELLMAASRGIGAFYFCSMDPIPGAWIRAGSRQFLDKQDHASNAKYLEAFQSLCKRGYIEHRSGRLFVLTVSGYERAARLAKG